MKVRSLSMINLRLLILFIPMFCFCQNKKQQIINLNYSIDSLNIIISSSLTEIDNLQIKYSKLETINRERDKFIDTLQTTNSHLQKTLSKYLFTIDSINSELEEAKLLSKSITNQYLQTKSQTYLSSWQSMCFLEKIQALISTEAEWYKTFIPEIIVNINEDSKIFEMFDGNRYNIPSYGVACGNGDLNIYKLDQYWYVAISEWPGDWESSSYMSLTIISSIHDFEPIVYSILDGEETYISEDCSVLLTKKNDNPCWGPGNIYNLFYYDGEYYGSLEVDCGSSYGGYNPKKLPFYDQTLKLNKTSESIVFRAYEEAEAGNGPTGNSYDLFKISRSGFRFNLEINEVKNTLPIDFLFPIITKDIVNDDVEIEEEEDDEILNFADVEDKPIYPGCENVSKDERYMCFQQGMMKHIRSNFKYPAIPKQMGISEKIFVQFVIDKAGNITKALVVRGEDKDLKEEALRLVNSIPKLQAAKQRGKPVPCSFTVPINFKLQ